MMLLTQTMKRARECRAAALIEAVLGIVVVSLVAGATLAGLNFGAMSLRLTRENTRASQILLEKVETLRLYTWDQVNSNGFMPGSFTALYDPQNSNNPGILYRGTVSITTPGLDSSYSNDLRLISVNLRWRTGELERQRTFTTLYSRYGMQDFIY